MLFGSKEWQQWALEEDEALPLIEHAYKSGIKTFDTADTYSHSVSEEIVGKALKKYSIPRHRVFIITKCYFGVDDVGEMPPILSCGRNNGSWVNRVGLSRKHIFDAVDASIERLGTYIDVLQIHRLDRETPEFQSLQNIAVRHGWHWFISMQNYHKLISREEEREMIPYWLDAGIGLIPWSPQARGILTRPWDSRPSVPESTDPGIKVLVRGEEVETEKTIVNRVEEVAKNKGISMAQVAIAWVLSHPKENPILGLSSKRRIDEAISTLHIQLTSEEIRYLEEPHEVDCPKGPYCT
ncbi:hypothetical protein N7491_007297 [Penicillium cf. griseofulvum]|uniref:NADP-dependent oxidoreductase domain-containing protein n=1 Tax=Penicillium cf. griseofulvum TaxID=2972120 RepID=A0A9W9IVL1_9EURO|nr:hypothetical protein N7472_009674 [Penicillium cf. griseofulvum]KAJ5430281.1 hypothetical protein N7491_007297 [Penicillium cf. griseofulvum]KAJ5435949.1 hypothetical protein N7445_006834 [Penicillium cf. griseofulvum]